MSTEAAYTKEDIARLVTSAREEGRRAGMEEAARVCQSYNDYHCEQAANEIRALKDKPA